jgi:hypothetical protein
MFESFINLLLSSPSIRPVIVAEAGNDTSDALDFPARFAQVVATSSINSRKELSNFSFQQLG